MNVPKLDFYGAGSGVQLKTQLPIKTSHTELSVVENRRQHVIDSNLRVGGGARDPILVPLPRLEEGRAVRGYRKIIGPLPALRRDGDSFAARRNEGPAILLINLTQRRSAVVDVR